jgi:hypothetical protein
MFVYEPYIDWLERFYLRPELEWPRWGVWTRETCDIELASCHPPHDVKPDDSVLSEAGVL